MAKAPPPRQQSRTEPDLVAKITMTIDGVEQTRTLAYDDIAARIDSEVRRLTGLPLIQHLSSKVAGTDSIAAVWWAAGRASGVKDESLDALLDLPMRTLLAADLVVEEDDDPEA